MTVYQAVDRTHKPTGAKLANLGLMSRH